MKKSKVLGFILWFISTIIITVVIYVLFIILTAHVDFIDYYRKTTTGECIKTSFSSGTIFGKTEHIPDGYVKDLTCKK